MIPSTERAGLAQMAAAMTLSGTLGVFVLESGQSAWNVVFFRCVFGALSLLLSGFLVVNTISALLTQQMRQIGVMKAIGANTTQLVGMYLATVLIYGLLALAIAVPLGGAGAYGFTRYLAQLINFDVLDYTTPPRVLALEVGAGLIVPLLAALWPVLNGARVSVREAISSYGLGKGRFGRSRIDRSLEHVRFLSRPLLLSLRNTFRII